MNKESQIEIINKQVSIELANEAASRALLATTFKGLNTTTMRQALIEGMIRGFKFADFLKKNVYAIPFRDGYSLITSIDYARKIGMRAGIVGKDAPVFEMDGKKVVSCTVTVKRKNGSYIGDYTATVFFDEYTTGKNLWISKPRTMLAKVAEMHALRMACPEELSQAYTEEEMEAEAITAVDHKPMEPYKVERAIPPADDEAGGAVIKDDADEMESAYEMALEEIKSLLIELGEKVESPAEITKGIKKYCKFSFEKANYSKILQKLREQSPMEQALSKDKE